MNMLTHTHRSLFVKVAALLCVLAVLFTASRAYAIGISPPIIPIDDMLRNSVQTHSVNLLIQNPAEEDKYYTVTPRGEYAHYIKGPDEHVIPAGETSARYTFDIEPIDAAVGTYELLLTFTEKKGGETDGAEGADGGAGANVAVTQGATLVISLGVTGEERVSFQVLDSTFDDTETKLPLNGSLTIYNDGNVEWKPDRLEIDVTDVKDETNTASFEVEGSDIPVTKPGQTQNARITLDHSLIEGKYRAKVRTYYQGEQVAEIETSPFNVFTPGTLDQSGELLEVTTNKEVYNVGEQVVLTAPFKNTGDVTVEALIETSVYKGDSLYNVELSRKLHIDRGQETDFQQFLKLGEPGKYRLVVVGEYGNRRTEPQEITVTVKAEGVAELASTNLFSYIVIGVVTLLIFLLLFFFLWKRRKKKEDENGQQPVPRSSSEVVPPQGGAPAAEAPQPAAPVAPGGQPQQQQQPSTPAAPAAPAQQQAAPQPAQQQPASAPRVAAAPQPAPAQQTPAAPAPAPQTPAAPMRQQSVPAQPQASPAAPAPQPAPKPVAAVPGASQQAASTPQAQQTTSQPVPRSSEAERRGEVVSAPTPTPAPMPAPQTQPQNSDMQNQPESPNPQQSTGM